MLLTHDLKEKKEMMGNTPTIFTFFSNENRVVRFLILIMLRLFLSFRSFERHALFVTSLSLSPPFQSIKGEKLLNKYKEGLHQRRTYPKGRRNEEKEQQKVVNLEKKNLKYMTLQHLN